MQTYLVERNLGAASIAMLLGLAAANHRQAAAMRAAGGRIHYLGSTYLPEEGRCHCMFEAASRETIVRHSAEASLPVIEIRSAILMPVPEEVMDGAT